MFQRQFWLFTGSSRPLNRTSVRLAQEDFMVGTAAVAVVAVVVGCVLIELLAQKDPRSEFIFALLDRLVSDESPLFVPDVPVTSQQQELTHRAA
jgi:hypothetical protein